MTQTTFALIVLVAGIGTWLVWGVFTALRASWRLGGVRLVTCPETGNFAAVDFNRMHIAVTAVLQDGPDTRLAHCSRWPEREGCDQPCVPQALTREAALTHLVGHWAVDHQCALCGRPMTEDFWTAHHVGVRDAEGVTREWPEIVPEKLPDALGHGQPVCWNCHISETFRRQHPDLVVER